MENPKDFHPDDLLERAVEAVLGDSIADDLSSEHVARLTASVRQAAEEPFPTTLIKRIKNMRSITRIAVAATVLFALCGLASWLLFGGGDSGVRPGGRSLTLKVQSASWKTTMTLKGPNNETRTTNGVGMFMAPSHERTVQDGVAVGIFDGEKDKALALDLTKKTAIVLELKNVPAVNPLGKTFQALRDSCRPAGKRRASSSGSASRPSTAGRPRASASNWGRTGDHLGRPEDVAADPRRRDHRRAAVESEHRLVRLPTCRWTSSRCSASTAARLHHPANHAARRFPSRRWS